MGHVETRQGALRLEIVAVLREESVTAVNTDGASGVDRSRPGIAEEVGQTLREPALQLHGQRIVIGLTASVEFLDTAELWIRRSIQNRACRAWKRLVESSQPFEPAAHRTDVSDLERRVAAKL